MTELGNDDSLLELAGVALKQAGYTVVPADAGDLRVLLGEDEHNVVVITALISPDQIVAAESHASRALTQRLVAADLPQKKWDAYVVLLCAQSADDDQTEALTELASNLRHLRRIVRVGVEATLADVARALRPLLPLPVPAVKQRLADPVIALQGMLLRDGLDDAVVQDLMDAFRLQVRTRLDDPGSDAVYTASALLVEDASDDR